MTLLVVVAVLVVGVLAWLAWISVQSLIQARLLFEARRQGAVFVAGRRVVLHGTPRIDRPIGQRGWGACLWFRSEHQELRGSGKRRRWATVSVEEDAAVFSVETPAGRVRVAELPTEIQACESRTDYGEPGCLGVFYTRGDTRTLSRWLSVPARVTTVGRIEGATGRGNS